MKIIMIIDKLVDLQFMYLFNQSVNLVKYVSFYESMHNLSSLEPFV